MIGQKQNKMKKVKMVKCLFGATHFVTAKCRAYNGFPVFVENRIAKPRRNIFRKVKELVKEFQRIN